MTISKSRGASFYWTGEEQKSLGGLYDKILVDQFAQAMRTLVNEVEADLAALYVAASRAYGTAGTTPFGTNLAEAAQTLKILQDNGAPTGDLQLVINTAASATLRILAQLNKANEAGSDALLRRTGPAGYGRGPRLHSTLVRRPRLHPGEVGGDQARTLPRHDGVADDAAARRLGFGH